MNGKLFKNVTLLLALTQIKGLFFNWFFYLYSFSAKYRKMCTLNIRKDENVSKKCNYIIRNIQKQKIIILFYNFFSRLFSNLHFSFEIREIEKFKFSSQVSKMYNNRLEIKDFVLLLFGVDVCVLIIA